MKKTFKFIFLFIFLTFCFSASMLKSVVFPGWGELSEYNALSKDNNLENIKFIKDRARYIMLQESSLWVGLYVSQDLTKSYKNDYRLLGETNAGVDWDGKNDLFSANVGNYNNKDEYNAYKLLIGQYDDAYLEEGYDWDWQNNNDNRLKYDITRNKSEKYNKIKTYLTAGLIINRVISSFDVLSIMKEHNRIISFDLEEDSSNLKLNLNYHF
tara:strand:+ start:18334 stop:18969 length:636 start_codon:yes stop_codon:yes gene_type:complete